MLPRIQIGPKGTIAIPVLAELSGLTFSCIATSPREDNRGSGSVSFGSGLGPGLSALQPVGIVEWVRVVRVGPGLFATFS